MLPREVLARGQMIADRGWLHRQSLGHTLNRDLLEIPVVSELPIAPH